MNIKIKNLFILVDQIDDKIREILKFSENSCKGLRRFKVI